MNSQEIFDTVALHLLTQQRKSEDSNGLCKYRSCDGLKCAVGCLIPDSIYVQDMEGHSIEALLHFMSKRPRYSALHEQFASHYCLLTDLQSVHDDYHPHQWKARLRKTAQDHDLSDAVLS